MIPSSRRHVSSCSSSLLYAMMTWQPMTPPLSLFPDPRLLLSFALSLLSYALHTVGETSSACRRVLRSLNVEFSGTHFRIAQVSSFSNLASNECPSLNLEDGLWAGLCVASEEWSLFRWHVELDSCSRSSSLLHFCLWISHSDASKLYRCFYACSRYQANR